MNFIKIVTNIPDHQKKYAAMYYKTEPFYSFNYHHTNNWEIKTAVEILCSLGYDVDLIDRGNKNWVPDKEYDIFLGLGVGNSGDQFVKYSKLSKAKKRVLLAMGPQPDISNERVIKRYNMFNKRTGNNAPAMRTVTDVIGEKFIDIIDNTDFIFCIGEKGTKSFDSFSSYNKPVLGFYPGVSEKAVFKDDFLKTRKRKNFLCFAGNGLICKGVDLLVESFLLEENKDKHLDICGPAESSFVKEYSGKINMSNNIKYHGFINVESEKFLKLASTCSYVIFHPSSEGCCTSVATAMKAGLVPIINSWTGINIENNINGFFMNDYDDSDELIIKEISRTIEYASNISKSEYDKILNNSLENSKKFSQKSFILSYTAAIKEVISSRG